MVRGWGQMRHVGSLSTGGGEAGGSSVHGQLQRHSGSCQLLLTPGEEVYLPRALVSSLLGLSYVRWKTLKDFNIKSFYIILKCRKKAFLADWATDMNCIARWWQKEEPAGVSGLLAQGGSCSVFLLWPQDSADQFPCSSKLITKDYVQCAHEYTHGGHMTFCCVNSGCWIVEVTNMICFICELCNVNFSRLEWVFLHVES